MLEAVEQRLDLIGQHELAGFTGLVGDHEDLDGPGEGIGPLAPTPQLGEDAVGAQPGHDHACLEHRPHRREVDHQRRCHAAKGTERRPALPGR